MLPSCDCLGPAGTSLPLPPLPGTLPEGPAAATPPLTPSPGCACPPDEDPHGQGAEAEGRCCSHPIDALRLDLPESLSSLPRPGSDTDSASTSLCVGRLHAGDEACGCSSWHGDDRSPTSAAIDSSICAFAIGATIFPFAPAACAAPDPDPAPDPLVAPGPGVRGDTVTATECVDKCGGVRRENHLPGEAGLIDRDEAAAPSELAELCAGSLPMLSALALWGPVPPLALPAALPPPLLASWGRPMRLKPCLRLENRAVPEKQRGKGEQR